MKKLLLMLTVAGMATIGCSTNQKNDAADADSNRIDTSLTNQALENGNDGAMPDTNGMGSDTTKIDTSKN
ncbi:MAG: hypothetical protein EOP00_03075 [Pedobacter sp.]|nr:MAG: hypothetical protein EOP00_03075 [Pedobacter sp.]